MRRARVTVAGAAWAAALLLVGGCSFGDDGSDDGNDQNADGSGDGGVDGGAGAVGSPVSLPQAFEQSGQPWDEVHPRLVESVEEACGDGTVCLDLVTVVEGDGDGPCSYVGVRYAGRDVAPGVEVPRGATVEVRKACGEAATGGSSEGGSSDGGQSTGGVTDGAGSGTSGPSVGVVVLVEPGDGG